jgi:hypothetical protein
MVLSGCVSMRIAYNHAPDLVYWKLDSYADFDASQKAKVKHAIDQWMRWHRTTELPEYVRLLATHRGDLAGPVTPAAVCALLDRGRERVDRGWARVLPAVADIAMTLKPGQLDRIEARYASSNEDVRRDHLQDSPDERRQARVKWTVESAEKLYGRLGKEQRAVVEAGVDASPLDSESWFAEREERQRNTLSITRQLIAEGAPRDRVLAAYKKLVADLRHSPNPAYASQQHRVHEYTCEFWARIHNSTTPAQRRHASERFERWATDFQLLIDEQ